MYSWTRTQNPDVQGSFLTSGKKQRGLEAVYFLKVTFRKEPGFFGAYLGLPNSLDGSRAACELQLICGPLDQGKASLKQQTENILGQEKLHTSRVMRSRDPPTGPKVPFPPDGTHCLQPTWVTFPKRTSFTPIPGYFWKSFIFLMSPLTAGIFTPKKII